MVECGMLFLWMEEGSNQFSAMTTHQYVRRDANEDFEHSCNTSLSSSRENFI